MERVFGRIKRRKEGWFEPYLIRWLIALLLNRNPKYCWAELVMWSAKYSTFEETKSLSCVEHDCECGWCGKCDRTGMIKPITTITE
jgi:hypothetical protein